MLIKTNPIGRHVLAGWLKFFTSESERFANTSVRAAEGMYMTRDTGLSAAAQMWKRCQVYLGGLSEWARKGSAGF